MWVFSMLLVGVVILWLTTPLIVATIIANNSVIVLRQLDTSLMKHSGSQVGEDLPSYEEAIRQALDTLQDRLAIRRTFEEMPMEDVWSSLRRLVLIQRAIVRVLQIVGGTASAVLQIFVDWEAQQEELESLVDEVVDAGHGVDSGENFDYDGNLDS